jgi:hypothetical protein
LEEEMSVDWNALHTPDNFVRLDESTIVEHDVLNVIQKITDYDPNLKVQYLDKAAALGDAPWRIIERCKDGEWRVLFYTWQMDERVLDRIRMADCNAVDVFGAMDANNRSLRELEGRRFRERMDEAADIALHVVKSVKKHTYTVKTEGKEIKFKGEFPAEVKELD